MHVALIGSRSSIHVVRWANALSKEGFKITVFSMHQEREEFEVGINFIQLPFRNPAGYVLNIPFLKSKIKNLNPDIVHSFYAFGHGFLGRHCSGQFPHVISVLGSDIYDDVYENRIYRSITVRNILEADVVCSTSKVMAKQIENICEQSMDIKITPFGIDTNLFKPLAHEKKEKIPFTVGTVKSLEYKYGIDILIRAFADFASSYSPVKTKLVIVGSGSKERNYKLLARELGIEKRCEFVGPVSHTDVPKWLAKMDIYVALSRLDSESFGVAVLEASAMKIPVIVSDVGGLPEIIQHQKQGLIIPKENVKAASEAMNTYYKNLNLGQFHGINGRRRVISKYKWEESVQNMREIYRLFRSII